MAGRNVVRPLNLLLFASGLIAFAHRELLKSPSCDGEFGSSEDALLIPDPSLSWFFGHYLDCTHRAVWMTFENQMDNFSFYIGLGTPPMPRFANLRGDALIIGPGLPQLSSEEMGLVPSSVRDDPVWNGEVGAILHRSPEDQSTCAHMGVVMTDSTTVRNGRCDFYERYTKTNDWRLLDADGNLLPKKGGVYHVAVWLQEDTSGKLGIALGTWVENFIIPFHIPTPSCNRSLLDWSEKLGSQEVCLPVTQCPGTSPIPVKNTCLAEGDCSGSSCEDTIADNAMCMFAKMCDCQTVIQMNPCGSVIESPMGNVEVNSMCGSTCNACGSTVHEPKTGCGGEDCPSAVKRWDEANMKMHSDMAINFTCDPKIDFVRGMIPHHQGAVDMCDVLTKELACEADGALQGLVHFCNHVRREQAWELKGMQEWLAKRNLVEHASCEPEAGAGESVSDCETQATDTISSHALCMYTKQCDCSAIIAETPCGSTIESTMGNTVVNDICGGTCGVCLERRRLGDLTPQGSLANRGVGRADVPRRLMGDEHDMVMGCGHTTCDSSRKFMAANMMIHQGMAIDFSCQHDVDFVRAMIPHHIGAVAMCEILKEASSDLDAYLVELCSNITHVQRAEVAFLSEWLVARSHKISATCEVCEGKTGPTQPDMPCEDMLPASSFCHSLGGDFYCTCEKAISAGFACGSVVEISGFGQLNASAECKRTCGLCPAERPPMFHSPCPSDPTDPMAHDGSGDMSDMEHTHGVSGNAEQQASSTTAHPIRTENPMIAASHCCNIRTRFLALAPLVLVSLASV